MQLLGMDIGGSHASVARILWDGTDAEISKPCEADVDTFQSAGEIVKAWADLVRQAAGSEGDIRLGIAMPGPFDYPNGVSLMIDQGKMKALYGLSVKDLLAESLGIDPAHISFTNDAEAFLLGESLAGAGRGFKNSVGLTLGTGLGSAFKVGEKVWDAKLWTAPFRDGIAEDYLGTDWIRRYTAERFGARVTGMKELLSGGFGREVEEGVLSEFGKSLGEFLYPYLAEMQLTGLVLGGKISLASERFLPYTRAYLDGRGQALDVRVGELGERAAMLGACLPFISSVK
ncbi:ROK family protein [Algoriphagus sp. H41]|uniref:ROK family protein n=1 Tax=Algoriphagus oliviformis TaxID=2811231 RepID=A0ABS3C6C8_9BACT|nr:ROK family protein [Algoriphagus oliviformis]MBN7812675.1 ROK family protein [Algoriphagus oliviformis]